MARSCQSGALDANAVDVLGRLLVMRPRSDEPLASALAPSHPSFIVFVMIYALQCLVLDLDQLQADNWAKLVEAGSKRSCKEPGYDHAGDKLPFPELHDEWLTPAEQCLREQSQKA